MKRLVRWIAAGLRAPLLTCDACWREGVIVTRTTRPMPTEVVQADGATWPGAIIAWTEQKVHCERHAPRPPFGGAIRGAGRP
jgi:hypothetical protein